MIGKLIAHGKDRNEALARMRSALQELVVDGIKTTIPLHRRILNETGYIQGGVNIHYLEGLLSR